jgi:hypothetical protein
MLRLARRRRSRKEPTSGASSTVLPPCDTPGSWALLPSVACAGFASCSGAVPGANWPPALQHHLSLLPAVHAPHRPHRRGARTAAEPATSPRRRMRSSPAQQRITMILKLTRSLVMLRVPDKHRSCGVEQLQRDSKHRGAHAQTTPAKLTKDQRTKAVNKSSKPSQLWRPLNATR